MTSVVVVDYGIGNLHSVVKALRYFGAEVTVSPDPKVITSADKVLLPGVGAFADGMAGLRSRGLDDALREYVCTERPLLGICLGMQLLLSRSEEFGLHDGFGFIDGSVVAIAPAPTRKVPQVGWNELRCPANTSWAHTVLRHTKEHTMMYFVHSFTAVPSNESDRLADVDYDGVRVSAAIKHNNITGLQFHPEKSGSDGLVIVQAFLQD
jgi:glutamine amidotransferase